MKWLMKLNDTWFFDAFTAVSSSEADLKAWFGLVWRKSFSKINSAPILLKRAFQRSKMAGKSFLKIKFGPKWKKRAWKCCKKLFKVQFWVKTTKDSYHLWFPAVSRIKHQNTSTSGVSPTVTVKFAITQHYRHTI